MSRTTYRGWLDSVGEGDAAWHGYSGLSTDTKPTTPAIGEEFWETDTRRVLTWNGSAWVDATVLRDLHKVPTATVAPDVSGSPKALQQFGDSTNDVFYLRLAVNAGDDVTAGTRLKNGYPDTQMLLPGTQAVLTSPTPITRIDVLAIGDTESGTPAAGEIATEASTEANIRLLMQKFTFDAADKVLVALVSASDRYSLNATSTGAPAPTQNGVMVHILGKSYA